MEKTNNQNQQQNLPTEELNTYECEVYLSH